MKRLDSLPAYDANLEASRNAKVAQPEERVPSGITAQVAEERIPDLEALRIMQAKWKPKAAQFEEIVPSGITAQGAEKRIDERLAALFASGTNSTLEWARSNPLAVIERVRNFWVHCVALECDMEYLVLLSPSDRAFFGQLAATYEELWAYQYLYGWDKSPRELQSRAFEVFGRFIEGPINHFRVSLSLFVRHLRMFVVVNELPTGTSLFGHGFPLANLSLQEYRSRGVFHAMTDILRSNNVILDAVMDVKSEEVYVPLKARIESERELTIEHLVDKILSKEPLKDELLKINRILSCIFTPVRRREEEGGI
jgi:hypothetical protein